MKPNEIQQRSSIHCKFCKTQWERNNRISKNQINQYIQGPPGEDEIPKKTKQHRNSNSTHKQIGICGNIAKSMGSYLPLISDFCEKRLLNDFKGKIHYGISELLDDKMNVLGPASLAFTKAEELVS